MKRHQAPSVTPTETKPKRIRAPKAQPPKKEAIEDTIDNEPPAGIKSGFSVFNPVPTTTTTTKDHQMETTTTEDGYTHTTNPLPKVEKTKQELASEKALAKIAAKQAKIDAKAAKEAEKEALKAAKLAEKALTAEQRAAAKAEREAARTQYKLDHPDAKYEGSMLSLTDRVKAGVYVKSATGQLRSTNQLAELLDGVLVDDVIRLAKEVLKMEENPYTKLNAGQQSMNFRNRMRGALAKGTLTLADVKAAIDANGYDRSASIAEEAAKKAAAKAERIAAAAKKAAKVAEPEAA